MSGNSYFPAHHPPPPPPQQFQGYQQQLDSPAQQQHQSPPPPPQQVQNPPPSYSQYPQQSPSQQPWGQPQSYPQPATASQTSTYNPATYAPEKHLYQQPDSQSWPVGYIPPPPGQAPINAPPTPAYTPSPHTNSNVDTQYPNALEIQYHQQHTAPSTPYAAQGQAPYTSSGAATLVQSPSAYPQPSSGADGQPSYFAATPIPPAYAPPHQSPAQTPQNGYPAEKQDYQQGQYPPAINIVHHTASQPGPSSYSSPPHADPQLYRTQSTPQPPHYDMHPQGKQDYYQHNLPQIMQPQPQYPQIGQASDFGKPYLTEPVENINQAFLPPPSPLPLGAPPAPTKDDIQSGKMKRFLGDTLMVRVARSGVATASSTWKMPKALSPWGDNNPVTLPNVRYRDVVLFTTFAFVGAPIVDSASDAVGGMFGADHFISELVGSGAGFITGNTIVKYGVFQIVEQAIDKGAIEHILPEVEKTLRTTSVKSLQVAIKHKLMGVDADIRYVGTYPSTNVQACEKGWFAPYLFASARTPIILRAQDFAMAQLYSPYLNGELQLSTYHYHDKSSFTDIPATTADTALAHKLLSENASTIPLCDPDPTHHLSHGRLILLFVGISPFRTLWSTSRRPGAGQLTFHLLDGCPALVLPVQATRTPILAWSPWTLDQMKAGPAAGYQAQVQHHQICEWLSPLVERNGLYPCVRDQAAFDRVVGRVISMIINGAVAVPPKGLDGKFLGKVDGERAGIVAFRY
ncbi:MAG: hypothetical protein M1812_001545 [Candelaria pacifica]|nr:MAG: hypothetical protein M1812_001545 [Candelaria pacifica]